MSYGSMWNELTGVVPKMPPDYAKTIVQRAWRDVRRKNLWSFLLFDSNWTSPAVLNDGTVSTTQGSPTVVFNATASTAIITAALGPPSPITARQFRIGVGTIYNIWDLQPDTPSAGLVTLTLDRNYQETTASGQAYMIYQCYYPAPMQDFWSWNSVRDMTNYNDLIITQTRAWVDGKDPQRTVFYIPTHVVPYIVDANPASQTYGWLMFELWGQPQFPLTYQLYGLRKGTPLVNNSDTLPPQIGEDCVMALARKYAYEWAEANKSDSRMMGSDYRFLMGEAGRDFSRLFREYRMQDRSAIDNFRTKLRLSWTWPNLYGWYSSIAGEASAGAAW